MRRDEGERRTLFRDDDIGVKSHGATVESRTVAVPPPVSGGDCSEVADFTTKATPSRVDDTGAARRRGLIGSPVIRSGNGSL